MTTAKFTRGPWSIVELSNQYQRIVAATGREIGFVRVSQKAKLHEEDWANLVLQVAAPEMYEALEINADIGEIWPVINSVPPNHPTLIKWLGNGSGYEAPEIRIRQLMEKAVVLRNAAIAKARGEVVE